MSISEILVADFDAEIASTRRLLERIPESHSQWKPHEKSMPMGRLALHVARLPNFCTRIFTTDEMNMATEKFPPIVFESTAQLLSELASSSAEAKAHVLASSDEHVRGHWRLCFGERVIVDTPRLELYRTMFLNHLAHHRGQLTVYLRLLDVPVPGLYGHSADEPFR